MRRFNMRKKIENRDPTALSEGEGVLHKEYAVECFCFCTICEERNFLRESKLFLIVAPINFSDSDRSGLRQCVSLYCRPSFLAASLSFFPAAYSMENKFSRENRTAIMIRQSGMSGISGEPVHLRAREKLENGDSQHFPNICGLFR